MTVDKILNISYQRQKGHKISVYFPFFFIFTKLTKGHSLFPIVIFKGIKYAGTIQINIKTFPLVLVNRNKIKYKHF